MSSFQCKDEDHILALQPILCLGPANFACYCAVQLVIRHRVQERLIREKCEKLLLRLLTSFPLELAHD